jgi:hypothetical protein
MIQVVDSIFFTKDKRMCLHVFSWFLFLKIYFLNRVYTTFITNCIGKIKILYNFKNLLLFNDRAQQQHPKRDQHDGIHAKEAT